MFPTAHKNVRRLIWFRNVLYVILAIVGFAALGIKTLLEH